MIFTIIFSILFLVIAIYNITQGVYNEAAAGLGISFILAGLFFFNKHQEKQINIFVMWLMENKNELKNDKTKTLMWNNIPVKYDSLVTQYQFCTSFLIITFKQPTSFILDCSSNKFLVNFTATIFTALVGWWGIPWGPIYTIQTIFRNIRGGTKKSIENMIVELENAEQDAGADG